MTLNSYYKFKRTTGKSRFDCIESTADYLHFEQFLINVKGYNKGGLSLHLGGRPKDWNSRGRRPDRAITKKDNISTLYLYDSSKPTVFYGDAQGTGDALIMIENADNLEIFIAKGLKNDQLNACYEFLNGGLDSEIEALKARIKTFDLPPIA